MIFASIEREDARPACPYLLGVEPRSCVTGCREEPRCITDEPLDGWTEPPIHPVNRVLVAYRVADETERQEFFEALLGLWLDLQMGAVPPNVELEVSVPEIRHGIRVIRRHRKLLP